MIQKRKLTLTLAAVLGLGFGAFSSLAINSRAETAVQDGEKVQLPYKAELTIKSQCTHDDEHWTKGPLTALRAEGSIEQSIYLSAIQYVNLERKNGDVRKAIPKLESIALRVPEQPLKNAIYRLLVDINLETNDHKGMKDAEQYLDKIVEESLVQF